MSYVFGLVVLILDIWAIMNVWSSATSNGAKIGWTIGIVLFPVIGFLAWLVAGPESSRVSA